MEHASKCDHFSLFKVPFDVGGDNDQNSLSVCYVKKNDLFFLALCKDDEVSLELLCFNYKKLFITFKVFT